MADTLDNAIWNLRSMETNISIREPSGQMKLVVDGPLPTDRSATRTPTTVNVALMDGDGILFEASAQMSIQGQSSGADPKPNYKLKLSNRYNGDELNVKIGSWMATSKLDFKGYGDGPYRTNYGNGDRSFVRDQACAALWRDIRRDNPFPNNLIAPFSAWCSITGNNSGYPSGALFSTAGYPCSIVHSTKGFIGLYILRTSDDNSDFIIDKKNPEHFLLQPQHASWQSWFDFDSTGWTISSPKMKGYNDQDQIKDTFPKVYNPINRICTWLSGVNDGSIDARETYPDYINLQSWIDYIIFCEITGSADAFCNNLYLVSWDATSESGVWHLCAYDLDETLGIRFGANSQTPACDPVKMGFVSASGYIGPFPKINQIFGLEIKERYAYLRNKKTISTEKLYNEITKTTDFINENDMETEIDIWGTNDQASIGYIMNWFIKRLEFIDSQWGYS